MLIFIFGANSYSSKEQVNAMRERFLEKFDQLGTNISIFDISDKNFVYCEMAQAISTPPFLSPKRMIIIKNLLSDVKRTDQKNVCDLLSKIPESTIVVVIDQIDTEKARKHAIVKAFTGASDIYFYEHNLMSEKQAISWVRDYVKKKDVQISDEIINLIIRSVGTDAWQLSCEIDKLVGYCKGRKVTNNDVNLLVLSNADDQLFACLDAIFQKNSKQVANLLEQQRQFGTSDSQIFAMLARQVRFIIACISLMNEKPNLTKQDVVNLLGIHHFVAQKLLVQSKRFSISLMTDIQKQLFEMEKLVKTSILNFDQAVDDVVVKLV
jgi:DNA polymerase-3 subunit delta